MKKNNFGFFAIELLIAIVVGALVMSLGSQWYLKSIDVQEAQVAADKQKQVNQAVLSYLKANYAAVATAITSSTQKYAVTLPTLESTGYLPPGFASSKNIYGQSWSVVVMEPNANMLRAIITTTGGSTISEGQVRRVARNIGAEGGYISSSAPTVANGAMGGWTASLPTYGLAPGAGHIASSISLADPAQTAEYFYRSPVPGHSELNAMTTNMDMNANSIKNVNNVAAVTASISNTLTVGSLVTSGDVTATNGAVNAKTVSATGSVSAGGGISATGAVTGSYVRGAQYTSGSSCSVPGAIGYDASGLPLACSGGSWAQASSTSPYVALYLEGPFTFGTYTSPYNYIAAGTTRSVRIKASGLGYISLNAADLAIAKKVFVGRVSTLTRYVNMCSNDSGPSDQCDSSSPRYFRYQIINVTPTYFVFQVTYSDEFVPCRSFSGVMENISNCAYAPANEAASIMNVAFANYD